MDHHSHIESATRNNENNAYASSSSFSNNVQQQPHSECPNDTPISLPRTMMDDDTASCVYKRPLHGITSSCFERNRNDHVAMVTPLNNIDSTITQIDDDNKQHTTYYECNKRLRYTTVDVPLEGITSSHPISKNVTMPTIAMETSTTTTGSVIPSVDQCSDGISLLAQPIPWWIQQQSQRHQASFPILSPTIQRSTSKCRICHKPYVPGQIIPDDTDEANTNRTNCTVTTTTTGTNYAKKIVYSNTNSTSGSNKTLLSYFPLRSTLVDDDDDKKQRSYPSNTKAPKQQQKHDTRNANNNNGDNIVRVMNTTTSQCHYCEHDDFCQNCSVQSCVTCSNHFCYFCRTIQQNGDIQCIDCYSSSKNNNQQHHNNRNTNYGIVEITTKSQKYKETHSFDDMDVD